MAVTRDSGEMSATADLSSSTTRSQQACPPALQFAASVTAPSLPRLQRAPANCLPPPAVLNPITFGLVRWVHSTPESGSRQARQRLSDVGARVWMPSVPTAVSSLGEAAEHNRVRRSRT